LKHRAGDAAAVGLGSCAFDHGAHAADAALVAGCLKETVLNAERIG
jgi:hypothetical protein